MGIILSLEEEISNIRWVAMPKRYPKKNCRVIMVDSIIIVAFDDGTFASSKDISKYAYSVSNWGWMETIVRALVKLKAITKEAAERHIAHCKKNSELQSKKYEADAMIRAAESLGITLTKAQLAKLKEIHPD